MKPPPFRGLHVYLAIAGLMGAAFLAGVVYGRGAQ